MNAKQLFQSHPSSLHVLTTRLFDSASTVGCLFRLDSHESGTTWYIINLLAVSSPRRMFGVPDFIAVTGQDLFVGVPLTCSFG